MIQINTYWQPLQSIVPGPKDFQLAVDIYFVYLPNSPVSCCAACFRLASAQSCFLSFCSPSISDVDRASVAAPALVCIAAVWACREHTGTGLLRNKRLVDHQKQQNYPPFLLFTELRRGQMCCSESCRGYRDGEAWAQAPVAWPRQLRLTESPSYKRLSALKNVSLLVIK